MSCCKGSKVVKWLGIMWYGMPKPKRIFYRGRTFGGCGCPVITKDAWRSTKAGLNHGLTMWRILSEQRKKAALAHK